MLYSIVLLAIITIMAHTSNHGDGVGAERRAAEKELQAIDRKLAKLELLRADVHERLARADQSNFAALTELTNELRAHDDETVSLEARWLVLSVELEA